MGKDSNGDKEEDQTVWRDFSQTSGNEVQYKVKKQVSAQVEEMGYEHLGIYTLCVYSLFHFLDHNNSSITIL